MCYSRDVILSCFSPPMSLYQNEWLLFDSFTLQNCFVDEAVLPVPKEPEDDIGSGAGVSGSSLWRRRDPDRLQRAPHWSAPWPHLCHQVESVRSWEACQAQILFYHSLLRHIESKPARKAGWFEEFLCVWLKLSICSSSFSFFVFFFFFQQSKLPGRSRTRMQMWIAVACLFLSAVWL